MDAGLDVLRADLADVEREYDRLDAVGDRSSSVRQARVRRRLEALRRRVEHAEHAGEDDFPRRREDCEMTR
jgi:hypothetical protein